MTVTRHVVLACLSCLGLLSLPIAGDPYQPLRALVAALALALALIMLRREPGEWAHYRWIVALIGFGLALTVVSALMSHPASALFGVHGRFQGLLTLVLSVVAGAAGLIALGSHTRLFARWLAAATVVQGAVVLIQASTGAVPAGTIGNQVLVGSVLCVGSAVAFAAARVESGRARMALLASGVIGAGALGVVGSRGAWIGLALAIVALLVVDRFGRATLLPLLAVGAIIVLAALAVGGEPAAKLSPASLSGGSAAARWQIWRGTVALVADNPVLGVGPGRFLYAYPEYQTLEHALREGPDIRTDVAHSHALQTAAESGVPAALALACAALLALGLGLRAAQAGDAAGLIAVVGFSAYVGQGLFGVGAIESDVVGWVLGGVAVARGIRVATPRDAISQTSRVLGATAASLAVLSLAIALGAGWYITADVYQAQGIEAFSQAQFADSYAAHKAASERNPLVDVYRVSRADAALYGGGALAATQSSLARGLFLEPASYDLALANARVLRAASGTTNEVGDAYLRAAGAYPLGMSVRLEAIPVLAELGRQADAERLARGVLEQMPDNPVARAVVDARE